MESQQTSQGIDQILSAWRRPGQTSLLGASALIGLIKAEASHARRRYHAHSAAIGLLVIMAVIIIAWLGQ